MLDYDIRPIKKKKKKKITISELSAFWEVRSFIALNTWSGLLLHK